MRFECFSRLVTGLGILLVLLVTACSTEPLVPTPLALAPTATAVPTLAPTRTPAVPTVSVNPARGAPRTWVTVTGRGFPGGARLGVHLGSATVEPTAEIFGEAIADPTGRVTISFAMPDSWPDGDPITDQQLLFVLANPGATASASASFDYQPNATPSAFGPNASGVPVSDLDPQTFQAISETVKSFMTAVQKDSNGKSSLAFLDVGLQTKVQKGQKVLGLLGIQSIYPSFQITAIEPSDQDNTAIARVTLQFAKPLRRVLLLTPQGNSWKISDIAADQ